MLGLDPWTLAAAAGIVTVGGAVSGVTGFGFGLVAVPALLAIFPPAAVVAMNRILDLVTGVVILGSDAPAVDRPAVVRLLPWAAAGLAGGVAILTRVDAVAIRLVAGSVVVAFAALAATGLEIPGIRSRYAPAVAGLTSGVMGTAIGMSGPPVVLLLASRRPSPLTFRATITCYFVLLDVVALALLARAGAFGWQDVRTAAALMPFAVAGRSLGRLAGRRVDRERFRRLTLGLLILTGISAVATALLALR